MGFWSGRRNETEPPADAGDPRHDLVRGSRLLDAEWYLATYPDVAEAGEDPVEHYLEAGAAAGRNPNALFDTQWYLTQYPDVHAAGTNPLIHFIQTGAAEGRDPGPEFDTAYYIAENPEVAAADLNPLYHFLQFGRAEGRLAKPRDEAEAFEAAMRARRLGLGGAANALFRGTKSDHIHFPLLPRSKERDAAGLALPSADLARRIGSPSLDNYVEVGQGTRDAIIRSLPDDFTFEGARCLDFGCGVARVLRCFSEEAKQSEFWGCDIDGASIRWSVENLSPPFRFFQISETSTIPFEDNSFDLVYAISVFSHIHVDWHHWLMEIRRIMKPGGTFFVTFMGQTPFEEMLGQSYWDYGPNFGMYVKNPHNNWNAGGPMVFLSPDWIKAFWGSMFDIDFIAMDGLLDYQSFCILRKPHPGAPIKVEAPVLELSTRQAFDPDALGRILAMPDDNRPFRDSYGIEAQPRTKAYGWIVFRGDKPVRLDALIDGRPVPAEVSFEPGNNYRDWTDSTQTAFAVAFDLPPLPIGEHGFEVRIESAGGSSHAMSLPLIVR